jgi:ribosomal protein S18 acetylase RimI-like enzyme
MAIHKDFINIFLDFGRNRVYYVEFTKSDLKLEIGARSKPMVVRSFQLSDYGKITDLLELVLDETCLEETMTAFARQLNWDSGLILVASEDEEVLGVMIGTIHRNKGYYYRVAVHPEHQRRGIARSLMEGMKQRFSHRHIQNVAVPVDDYNEQLLPVYEKLGCGEENFNRSYGKLSILAGC